MNSAEEKEKSTFKFRFFTNKIPNAVVVTKSWPTGKLRVHTGFGFHLPTKQARYVATNDKTVKKEYNNITAKDGIAMDTKVSYVFHVVEPPKLTLSERLNNLKTDIKNSPFKKLVKYGLAIGSTAALSILATPLVLIPSAVYAGAAIVTYQEDGLEKKGGAAAFAAQGRSIMDQLDSIIKTYVSSYIRKNNHDILSTGTIDLSDPVHAELKNQLETFTKKYGIEVSDVKINAMEMNKASQAIMNDDAEAKADKNYIQAMIDMGYSLEDAMKLLMNKRNADAVKQGNVQHHNIMNNGDPSNSGPHMHP